MVMATKPPPAATQPAPTQSTSAAPAPNQGTAQQGSENHTGAAPVSPDNVGRLFVQQYYTVLNKAPNLLHRFYTKGSSFVHGKVDRDGNAEEPVYGQNEIYLKIMTLDFQECYAKIRQVDSYATLGDGVVVQVTGELSTHGKPMRRFTQTFVLAPHSARNYYVRNDIFRYHDEVFQENEDEEEDRVESDEETVESPQEKPDSDDVEDEEEEPEGPPPAHSVPISTQETSAGSPYYSPPPSVSNGTNHLDSPPGGGTPPKISHQVDQQVEERQEKLEAEEPEQPIQDPVPASEEPAPPSPVAPSPPPQVSENHQPDIEDAEKPEVKEPAPPQENKIVSWADRARQSPSSITSGGSKPPVQPPVQAVSAPPPKPSENFGGPPAPRSNQEGLPQREPRRTGRGSGNWTRRGPDASEGERRGGGPGRMYPDKCQLFVGNLPQDIKDEELKEFFSKHGNVVELRINRNSNPRLPFFGFVVFDEPGPVQTILKLRTQKPIFFRDGYRLNVEEKKNNKSDGRQRVRGDSRPSSGGGPPHRGGASGRGGGRGGPGVGTSRLGRGFNPPR